MTDKHTGIDDRIKRYGGDIIKTEEFKRMFSQRHHLKDSLGRHTVSTARMGLTICDFLKRRGISVDEEKVVRTALLHDLGMLDRGKRYKNNFECGRFHPGNSAIEAKKLWPDIDDKSLDAIKSHMWPLSLSMPKTKEAFILCLADKLATMKDIV
jgi:hypothetical protein